MPLIESLTLPTRPFEPDGFYDNQKVSLSFTRSPEGTQLPVSVGNTLPPWIESVTYEGFFRNAECEGETSSFGYWADLDACENEVQFATVLVDECGDLVPAQPFEGFQVGRLGAEHFVRADGRRVTVAEDEEGNLTIGSGADRFELHPLRRVSEPLSAAFQTLRGHVIVSEQTFEYQEGAVGLPLEEPRVVYAAPWRVEPGYQGTSSGHVHVRAGGFSFDAVVRSDALTESGVELTRDFPLCPDYSESIFLREEAGILIIEQRISRTGTQTLVRRLYQFE